MIGVPDVGDRLERFEERKFFRHRFTRNEFRVFGGGEKSLGQSAELELVEEQFQRIFVARRNDQFVPCHLNGNVDDDGGKLLGEERLPGVGDDVVLLFALELGGVGDEIFDRVKLGDELFGGLLADPGNAGDVVRRVTPESEDIDDLGGSLDLPIGQHRGKIDDLVVRPFAAGFPH